MECLSICSGLNHCFGWVGRIVQPFLLLFIRLFWGSGFLFAGWYKLANIAATASAFAGAHIPVPLFNAYFVGIVELIGGVLLIIGLFSRLVTIPLIITLLVAFFTAHYSGIEMALQTHSFSPIEKEAPFFYLVAMFVVLCFGAGLFSVDYFIGHKHCKSCTD